MSFKRGTLASRFAALGLAATLGLILAGLAAAPLWRAWSAQGEEILARRAETQEARSLDEAGRRLGLEEGEWRRHVRDPRSGFSPEDTAQLAADSAIRRIRSLITAAEGRWDEGGLIEVAKQGQRIEKVRFFAKGALPESRLSAFLTALESEPPFLFLDKFGAVVESRPNGRPPVLALTIEGEVQRMSLEETAAR
ncbi:GspMb/PilO family protein [Neomegalonema sp.]|uniref:GspMb/PilO family protein n=1 Tax=Neomegalonema sp. TaxID=2039713 RepID=UPI0026252302|nr:GspMb/PilO family protein [Neomegalonema sp.]MDD2868770.1 GspMb/PilO family protein [Neomegalonema sp.]